MAHDIYQSRRRREKETNPGIGIGSKYVDSAKYVSKCPKFD